MASATPFEARTVTLCGRIVLPGPVEEVFPLFSPLGERSWVDAWEPEIVAPRGTDWAEGMVFRVPSEGRMDIWIVAHLDRPEHHVVYYRTEPERLVARVEVCCSASGDSETLVTTTYSYVGLSEAGNRHIAEWTDTAYAAKMERWQATIAGCLRRGVKSAN